MAVKNETKAAAAVKKTTACKRTTTRKTAVKSAIVFTAENIGFKAGDVYQALATAAKALSVCEIAKAANISEEEVLLGTGWLLKEGKVTNADGKIVLA